MSERKSYKKNIISLWCNLKRKRQNDNLINIKEKENMTKIQGRNENLFENNPKYQSVISSKAFGAKRNRVYSSL